MRRPDFIIGGRENPYMLRWWVIPRNRWFNIYLHKILRDDDDRALHDHPWWNVSIVLSGAYVEITPDFSKAETPYARIADLPVRGHWRGAGSIIFRRATACHRLALPAQPGTGPDGKRAPCWSLFITGPRIREWGFHCPKGWRIWREFVGAQDTGAIGRGCE